MAARVIIELDNISKRYGYGDTGIFALKNFNLSVKQGEFIMIMGPSGCGKTTLLNIIGLLDHANSGDYYLDDQAVDHISARKKALLRAKKIGFIFQNFNLIQDLPIIENVTLPLVYSGQHKTSRLKTADAVLERFHLREREYYMPWQLSGGQQQRVAIARSLISNPEIILADEPTGNLDSRSSHIVMEELKNIHQEGNTIIMVTHNPALTTYATRVIHMLDGGIDTDVKTVADRDLPQPISVRFIKKSSKEEESETEKSTKPKKKSNKNKKSKKSTKTTKTTKTAKSTKTKKTKSTKTTKTAKSKTTESKVAKSKTVKKSPEKKTKAKTTKKSKKQDGKKS